MADLLKDCPVCEIPLVDRIISSRVKRQECPQTKDCPIRFKQANISKQPLFAYIISNFIVWIEFEYNCTVIWYSETGMPIGNYYGKIHKPAPITKENFSGYVEYIKSNAIRYVGSKNICPLCKTNLVGYETANNVDESCLNCPIQYSTNGRIGAEYPTSIYYIIGEFGCLVRNGITTVKFVTDVPLGAKLVNIKGYPVPTSENEVSELLDKCRKYSLLV